MRSNIPFAIKTVFAGNAFEHSLCKFSVVLLGTWSAQARPGTALLSSFAQWIIYDNDNAKSPLQNLLRWPHQMEMETFFALLALCAGHRWIPIIKVSDTELCDMMFSLICALTNGWVHNRDAGDLIRHRAHNDVTVMQAGCMARVPSSLYYKTHLSWQSNCWSLRCSWRIACRRCSNYIFILDLTHGFNRLGKDNCKTGRESLKFWNLVRLI